MISIHQKELSLSEISVKVLTQESTMVAQIPSLQHVPSVFKIIFVKE